MMLRTHLRLALAAAAMCMPAFAQEASPPVVEETPIGDIEIAEFHAMVDGKTVYFELENGELWGREYYRPGTQETVFRFANSNECSEGYWRREGARYCYYYRATPSCWLTFKEDDKIIVESRGGMRQRVRKIVSGEPISCDPIGVSQAAPEHLAKKTQ